jgi:1-acyl-sn-glycerol-3-phosphate acyltransferase
VTVGVGGSLFALRAFDRIFLPWMRRRLTVHIAGLPRGLPVDEPLILVANHVSWWDGFVLRELHRCLRPGTPLHTVMLESELRRLRPLRALGAVGMKPGNPASIAHTIRTLGERLRQRPDSVVNYFPQGRIWPSHRRPLGFERGVELFARRLGRTRLIPVGIHIEPLQRVAPSAFVHAGPPLPSDSPGLSAKHLESAVAASLDAIHAHLARHGERALESWPAPFEPLEPAR